MYNTGSLRVTMGPEAWDAAVFSQVVPGWSPRVTAYSASHLVISARTIIRAHDDPAVDGDVTDDSRER